LGWGETGDVVANAKTAPIVTKINGIDASKYIQDTVNSASYLQDPDASYNTMFWSKSTAATPALGLGSFVARGRSNLFYHGPTTSLTFSNGTTVELENLASVVGDMSGITDGPSMYKKFCSPQDATEESGASSSPSLTGYPSPKTASQDGAVTGYYLTGQGLDDVAVLVVKSFDPLSVSEFQGTIMNFLSDAKDAGKKKLVIDLQNNPGGLVLLGYDLFRQLFPKTVQEGNSRFKMSQSAVMAAQLISDATKGVDASSDNDLIDLSQSWLNFRHDMSSRNTNFVSLADKFGPHVYQDTNYSSLIRFNVSDPLETSDPVHGLGIDITGYGCLTDQPQFFQPEDIILLYDGSCSSTCTVTSDLLRVQGGLKSVTMGGRPKAGPMQGVGGIKGSQVLSYSDVYSYITSASQLTNDTKILAEMKRFSDLPMKRSTASTLNVRDSILPDHVKDGLPSQYVYSASDCRLFWTAPMITDVTEVWKAAANAAFNGAKCAYGGIAGSKPGRRSEPAPASAPASGRLVKPARSVDDTQVSRSQLWLARHLQVAVM